MRFGVQDMYIVLEGLICVVRSGRCRILTTSGRSSNWRLRLRLTLFSEHFSQHTQRKNHVRHGEI